MLRKYIPRAYKNLPGTAGLQITPTVVLSTGMLAPFYSSQAQETFRILGEIGAEDAKAKEITGQYQTRLAAMGFPSMMSGISEAPYDILAIISGAPWVFLRICWTRRFRNMWSRPAGCSRISRFRRCSISAMWICR